MPPKTDDPTQNVTKKSDKTTKGAKKHKSSKKVKTVKPYAKLSDGTTIMADGTLLSEKGAICGAFPNGKTAVQVLSSVDSTLKITLMAPKKKKTQQQPKNDTE